MCSFDIIQKRLKVMENKLLEQKHQRKLLQDCTEQVIVLYMMLCVYLLTTYLYGFNYENFVT